MSEQARALTSRVLAVAGCVFALVGGFALYAHQEIFNADAFAENSSEALKDDQFRKALRVRIVDQALDHGPDALINATPLLEEAVDGVLRSTPFRSAYRKAARKLYHALFVKDPDELALTVASADTLITEGVSAISPKAGKQVPRDLGDRVVEVTDSGFVLTVVRVSERVRVLGIVLPILAGLFLAGSIALARDGRRGLLFAVQGLTIASAVGFGSLLIGRSLLLGQFHDDTVRDAVAALWESFMGGLSTWTLYVGLISIVIWAAAAMARERDPVAPVRRILERATRPPKSDRARALRAVGIGLLGVFFVTRPHEALQLVAVLLGAYALFFAVCELLGLIAPPPRQATAARRRLSRRVAAAGAAVLLLLLIGGVALATGGEEGKRDITRPSGPVTNCNGFPELCDKTLDQVAFPATHNAMSAAKLPEWYQPNQRFDIRRQLDDGVRAFLIDSHYGIKREGGPVLTDLEREGTSKILEAIRAELGAEAAAAFQSIQAQYTRRGGEGESGAYFCHIVCELGATSMSQVLGWFRDFLDAHPDEVLVLFIEDKVTPSDAAEAFEKSGLLDYAYIHKRGQPFPTLRQMIESNHRLFVMAEVDSGQGAIPWYHQGFDLAMETPYTFHTPAELANPASCLRNRGGIGKPLFQLNHWVEKLPRSPDTAAKVNDFKFLLDRARTCEHYRKHLPGIVAVDYYNEGDLLDVTEVLNGVLRETEPSYRERD